jgi:hypothetical protein
MILVSPVIEIAAYKWEADKPVIEYILLILILRKGGEGIFKN